MAYKIESEKGKKIAEELKIGDKYEASDGSVWEKENDGTITVKTSGNTYKISYTTEKTGRKGSGKSYY